MSCIFESNLRNNPIHNRHILRENFDGKPFIMPEDPTDGKPEEMPESHVYEVFFDDSVPVDEIPDAFTVNAPDDDTAFGEILDRWDEEYEAFPIQDVTKDGVSVKDEFDEYSSSVVGNEEQSEPSEDMVRMESCVMGSNLFGHGGYGKAILREMYGDADMPQTISDRLAEIFDGNEEYLSDAETYMEDNGFDLDEGADSVDDETWHDMYVEVTGMEPDDGSEGDDGEFTDEELEDDGLEDEEDLEDGEEFDDEGLEDEGLDDEGLEGLEDDEFDGEDEFEGEEDGFEDELGESYELHSMLSVEGHPTYEEPEVKKEPKPKAPRLTAKRNRRLRSKSRNIQIWDNKKKRFDPKYINTRFARMRDANDAIAKIGESCECGRKDCKCGCTPLARKDESGKTKKLRAVKRIKRKALPPGQVYEDEN